MYYLMRRQGWLVGRDQIARVMKTRGITGVKRGKTTFTTKTKTSDSYPLDRVQRQFVAERPNQLWVSDITYVATWQGFAYVAFVTDVFSRKIVGWSVPSTLKTDMLPLQALNMAAWMVSDDLTGLEGLTRFCGHSRLVVSSCRNHDVVVESLKVGGADHSEAGVPPFGVIPTLNPLEHRRGELNPAGPGLPVE